MPLPTLEVTLVVLVALPLAAAALQFGSGRQPRSLTLGTAFVLTLASLSLLGHLGADPALDYAIGDWEQPLGIHWRLTPLAICMLLVTALVGLAGAIHACAHFVFRPGPEGRVGRVFMPLWLFAWGALNALFLGADLFNLYVALELLTLSSVALVALAGGQVNLQAAMRYLLAALFGSVVYLLGVGLLYGQYGRLDLDALAAVVSAGEPGSRAAAVALTVGLLSKAAIFPLHFWLPAAHGRAEAPVSALLSGLVVAAAFYLLLRLWTGPLAVFWQPTTAGLLGAIGVAAMLWGGVQALLQRHLKMVIAYSTISQFGFLLLLFPLGLGGNSDSSRSAVALLLANHALAKAALFLAAGTLIRLSLHDRIDGLAGARGAASMSWLAIALAAAALLGLPPSFGFQGKWLLLQTAVSSEAWVWLAALLAGTLLTFAYLGRLLERGLLAPPPAGSVTAHWALQAPALLLAATAMLAGLATLGSGGTPCC